MQQHDAFQHWQRERDEVEAQMNALLAAGLPASREDRLARQIQFQALVERREAAARDFLRFGRLPWQRRSPATHSETANRPSDERSAGESNEPTALVPAGEPVALLLEPTE